MARILSSETSLKQQKERLARESRLLNQFWKIEAVAAMTVALYAIWRSGQGGGAGWLIGAAALGFLAVSHYVKARQNARDARFMKAGIRGEGDVARVLSELLDDDYTLFNDIRVRSGFSAAQIDHLVVSRKGLFVIETKNWRGRIVGDGKARKWLQYRGEGQPARSLDNPILQNRRHVDILKRFLGAGGVPSVPIIPLLVFTGRDTTLEIANPEVRLMWPREAAEFILQYTTQAPLDEHVVAGVIERLKKCL